MAAIETFLKKFEDVQQSGAGWEAKCPVHNDTSCSLRIMPRDDGGISLECTEDCALEDILQAVGLAEADIAADESQEFINTVFADVPDTYWLYLWTDSRQQSKWFKPGCAVPVSSPIFEGKKNIYIGLGLSSHNNGPNKRVIADAVCGLTCLWIDLDVSHGDGTPPDRATADALINSWRPQPSIIVDSGNGYHIYHLLDEPWYFNSADGSNEAAQKLMRDWVGYLEKPFVQAGYKNAIDHAATDISRVLRLPNTKNWKDKDNPKDVTVAATPGGSLRQPVRYSIDYLRRIADTGKPVQTSKPTAPGAPTVDDICLGDTDVDPVKIDVLITNLDGFGDTWNETRTDLADASPSGYRYALLNVGARAQWSDQEIYGLVCRWYKVHGHDAGKLARLLPKELQRVKDSIAAQGAAQDETKPQFRLTERGAGERFAHLHKDQVRFCVERKSWLWFDGQRWSYECRQQIEKLCRATVRHIDAEYYDLPATDARRKELQRHAGAIERRNGTAAMLDFASRQDGICVYLREFDSHIWLLNCRNGTLDLKTGELRPHSSGDMLTQMVDVDYDPDAKAPLWGSFLQRVMANDDELIDYLQRAVGMGVTGDTSEHLFFLLYGSGCNGKSVFTDVLVSMLGDYSMLAPEHLFTEVKFDSHPCDLADLEGRRLVIGSETAEGRRLQVQRVKRLCGDATLKARRMRENFFEFSNTATFMLSTNNLPQVRENTVAIWRRLRVIPFRIQIPTAEQDKHLIEKLCKESTGILAWCVQGCLAWQRQGITTPEAVMTVGDDYKVDENILEDWLNTRCCFGLDLYTDRTAAWADYLRWATSEGERNRLGRNAFYGRIREIAGVSVIRKRYGGKTVSHLFRGIGLSHNDLEVTHNMGVTVLNPVTG